MKIKIKHSTTYYYSDFVSLGVHRLYLLPQFQEFQRILESKLTINPNPNGKGNKTDLVGNSFVQVWFADPTDRLMIQSEMLIDCIDINPFGFIIDPYFISDFNSPDFNEFTYRDDSVQLIQPYIHREFTADLSEFTRSILLKADSFLDFLVKLTAYIHANWTHIIREEEDLWTTDKTFGLQKGSCRDLAWMQMNMLGSLGLASRFVSGYAFNPEVASGHELHAWLQTYLPGAGWIGLDPSLGLLTNQLYVPLAYHPDPSKTLPVQGSYGGGAKSKLETDVIISQIVS
jgi:transglutaminase-like putative cysteine protease